MTAYVEGILNQNRSILGRAITLIESQRGSDRLLAESVLREILPHTGQAIRIGITGVPGVGKSTFLDKFGMQLIDAGKQVAVLAIDPSSSISGGSILGDKTRMHNLSMSQQAFVRPSPTDSYLGGVARKTKESMLLCEAAGYDVILVESVGVGQSETILSSMVDCFVALMLPNAGDELQGIKKGLLEMVDIIAINKSDGDFQIPAKIAQREYAAAVHYLSSRHQSWKPQVCRISGLTGDGLPELWEMILDFQVKMQNSQEWEGLRQKQRSEWLMTMLKDELWWQFIHHEQVKKHLPQAVQSVQNGSDLPNEFVRKLLSMWGDKNP